jgi:hypothetical protein
VNSINTPTTIAEKGHDAMLKDSLKQLIQDPDGKARECKLGKIIKSQDSETAEVIVEALLSSASTMGIVRALGAEGINLSREYLGEKRATCFKDPDAAAKCCLNKQDKDAK